MIDVRQINESYRSGREKPNGKVYVMGNDDIQIASYSALTKTLEWYQTVSPEQTAAITAYLQANY